MNKKKLMLGSIVAAGAALVAASAMAAEGKDRGWDRMDANGDGKVTAEELSAQNAKFLADADANGDGAVTREEAKAFHKAKREEMRAKRNPDKNGDGLVDRTEFVNAAQERFDRMDKNDDGVLSKDEMGPRKRGHHGRRDKNDD